MTNQQTAIEQQPGTDRQIAANTNGSTVNGPVAAEQPTTTTPVVSSQPNTVVEEPYPTYAQTNPTYAQRQDTVGSTMAASAMIQTLVWSVVVIVLLVVGILVLIHYHIL